MRQAIATELEILWSDFEQNSVDDKLDAYNRLQAACQEADLQDLLHALSSEKSDFWVRELLSEPICQLGGPGCLPQLFDALQKNEDDGHDNDSFCHFLMEMAVSEPEICRKTLIELMATPEFEHKGSAQWLLDFCE